MSDVVTWIPTARVKEAVANILKKSAADPLDPSYDGMCDEANRLATADLRRVLELKGYTDAQIEGWDDRGRYALDQAIYWALMRSGGLGGYPDTFAKAFDRRAELDKAASIRVGGVTVPTGGGAVGGIMSGQVAGVAEAFRRFDSFGGGYGGGGGRW